MGTYESVVTSCSIIACGKIGAKASGPTGSIVAGLSGGSNWKGRSGTRLYQLSGMAFSSRRYFVCSTVTPVLVADSGQPSAYSFSGLRVVRLRREWYLPGLAERCVYAPVNP